MKRTQPYPSGRPSQRAGVDAEAMHDYYERLGKMSEQERKRMLRIFDELVPRIPARSRNEIQRELQEIRLARRLGGRASATDRRK